VAAPLATEARLREYPRMTAGKSTRGPAKAPPAKKPAAKRPAPKPIVSTGYWLFKSEPDVFSWEMLKAKGGIGEPWTGVRNFLARNNMRAMAVGDLGFFYHSNIGKEIVGICRVIAPAHPDPDDGTGTWECVDVVAGAEFNNHVTLGEVKDNPKLSKMSLVTSMRLSVQPVTPEEWAEVCRMGGLDPKKHKR
jgi:predicted RNA-binding protein with PUA-like domain